MGETAAKPVKVAQDGPRRAPGGHGPEEAHHHDQHAHDEERKPPSDAQSGGGGLAVPRVATVGPKRGGGGLAVDRRRVPQAFLIACAAKCCWPLCLKPEGPRNIPTPVAFVFLAMSRGGAAVARRVCGVWETFKDKEQQRPTLDHEEPNPAAARFAAFPPRAGARVE